MAADDAQILRGEPVSGESKNAVRDVPDNFKEWVSENEERIERASALPMFLRDNKGYVNQSKVDVADILQKVNAATAPRTKSADVAFDPFSPIVIE